MKAKKNSTRRKARAKKPSKKCGEPFVGTHKEFLKFMTEIVGEVLEALAVEEPAYPGLMLFERDGANYRLVQFGNGGTILTLAEGWLN